LGRAIANLRATVKNLCATSLDVLAVWRSAPFCEPRKILLIINIFCMQIDVLTRTVEQTALLCVSYHRWQV